MTIKPYINNLYVASCNGVRVIAPNRLEAMRELSKLIFGGNHA